MRLQHFLCLVRERVQPRVGRDPRDGYGDLLGGLQLRGDGRPQLQHPRRPPGNELQIIRIRKR